MTAEPPIARARAYAAAALSLSVFVLALFALHRALGEFAWSDVRREMSSLGTGPILLSILATVGSYTLLTTFDWVAVRLSGKVVPLSSLVQTAFIANAFGHNLGMSALTGGTVRARAYADFGLDAAEIARIIATASIGFLFGAAFWLGCALTGEPGYVSQAIRVPEAALRIAGPILLALPGLALVALAFGERSFARFSRSMGAPGWRAGSLILVASSTELACAAAALYALLPAQAEVSYLAFIGLYVLAVSAGVVSTVPGGVGVFEATLLIVLPRIPPHVLLAAVLVYRSIYYFLPLLAALLLLGARSIRRRPKGLVRQLASVRRWTDPLVAPAFAILVFAAGAALVLTGSLPLDPEAKKVLANAIALPALELSHLAGSAIGVVLLLLASGVYQRIYLAWWLSMAGLALAAVFALLAGLRWPLSLAVVALMLPLWSARDRFYRNHSLLEATTEGAWVRSVLLVIASAAWLGVLVHRNLSYENELWWQFAFESDAPRSLRALLVSLLVLVAYGLMRLLWPLAAKPLIATELERNRAAAIIANIGRADAHLALLPDKQLLFAVDEPGFVMYQRSGPCLIAMGDPVGAGPVQQRLAWQFRELADRAGLSTVFYQVSAVNLPIYLDMGLTLSKLGEEAIIALADFTLTGPSRAVLRQEHRRAVREGARFEILAPQQVAAAIPRLREISEQWLEGKQSSEKRFSLGFFDADYLVRTPCAVARRNDQIVAFTNLWTTHDRSELSIDLMRYADQAPRYVMDFLFIELMLWGKANGYREFNLGMAPLAGMSAHALAPLWHKLGDFAWRHGERFYHFEGLRRYKNKFSPEWRPRYLASPGGLRKARVMLHISRLISGGTVSMQRSRP